MRTLKFGVLVIALAAVFISCDKSAQDKFEKSSLIQSFPNPIQVDPENVCGQIFEKKLMAGQHIVAGVLQVWVADGTLYVKYDVSDYGNLISETHLAVETEADKIPHNNAGNPKIGNFEFTGNHNPMTDVVTYEIDLEEYDLEGIVSIAAHAVVMISAGQDKCMTVAEIEALIPEEPVTIAAIQKTMVNSYHDLTLSDAGEFNGTHLAWCIDNNGMPVRTGDAMLVSSYSSEDLSSVVRTPANLDILNYLMNHYYPQTPFKVLQVAIWKLMNGMTYINGSGDVWLKGSEYLQCASILADVMAKGEGYVPGPGENMVIIAHYGNIDEWQNIFFLYKKCTPVYKDETAWAQSNPLSNYDIPFTETRGSWATYFGFQICE